MALQNLLKQQVDLPVFEWMRFAPVATVSTSALVSSDEKARYMYYINAQAMWRYDTYSDSWQECAPPNIAPVTAVAAKYAAYSGSRGHTISATSTTITIGGLGRLGNLCIGNKIRIIAGTGAGQERTITGVSDGVIHDNGLATTASATQIGDSTKRWRVNQWDGYNVRLTYSTGQSQIRRILYNDTTTLTLSDTNHQAVDHFNNTGFSAVSPFAVPVTSAGSQTHFVIESTELTVNSSWTVTPDASSVYQIMTGGIWLLSSTGSTPFATWQFYDILLDTWFTKTPIGPAHITAALGTDFAIDRTGEAGGVFVSGVTASSATAKTLVHSGATYEYDRYANHQIRIVSGTGVGQRRRIAAHTADTFYIEHKWDITPDNTSGYAIYGDTDKMWVAGNGSAALLQYSVEKDLWATAPVVDSGVARQISATPAAGNTGSYGPPHEGYAITSITYSASGILTVAVNAGGTNYVVGDLVTCSAGTGGQAYVTSVSSTGAVTGLQLAASGSGYSAGSTNTTGGSGSGLTITITVGKVGNVTTAVNHDFRHGESVTIAGCATETTFNATFQIIGTASLTTFSIAANASATQSPTAANSLTTSLIVDAAQNWTTNEHVGRVVHVQTAGVTPTSLGSRRITANTATTLTLASAITAMTNGQSRYIIQEMRPFGAMCVDKVAERSPNGWATSGSSTTLVDSTKNWRNNQYLNCRVRVVAGTGEGNDAVITANSATTLTVASWGVATPDSTSKYEIMDSYGIITTAGTGVSTLTDANKNFPVNYLAGKRVRYVGGTAVSGEGSITSNTATVITISTTTTNATDTVYCVYEIPARSTGTDIKWLFGLSDTAKKGRWMISPRGGGSNLFDIFDIPTSTWEITPFITPITATLTTGSMYVYDGADSYYFTKDNTNRIYVLDLAKFKVDIAGSTPYAHGTATLSNKFEIVKTADDLSYIYIMRHSGFEMWRTLKFW